MKSLRKRHGKHSLGSTNRSNHDTILNVPFNFILSLAQLIQRYKLQAAIIGLFDTDVKVRFEDDDHYRSAADEIEKEVKYWKLAIKKHEIKRDTKDYCNEVFYVPEGFITQFADLLEDGQFTNEIIGVYDDEIMIQVSYNYSQRRFIDELFESITDYEASKRFHEEEDSDN